MVSFFMALPRKSTTFVEGSLAWRLDTLARKVGNLSELARLSGVSNSVLSRCLKGGVPSAPNAVAVAAAAKVSLEWLLTGKEPYPTASGSNSVRIPFFQVEASAGPGLIPMDENHEQQSILVPSGILPTTGLPGNPDLCAIQAKGDSMHPTIPSGSLLVVNRSDRQLREGIYVISRGESLLVKRTQPRENKMLRLKSDNPQYEHEDIDLKDPSQNFQIFGRVIWTGHSI